MEAKRKNKGLQKTLPKDLTIGMFISELDRDWSETRFPLQGFYVRNQQIIDQITEHCAHVFVDPRRYDSKLSDVKLHAVGKGGTKDAKTVATDPRHLSARERLQPKTPVAYEDSVDTADEVEVATTSLEQAEHILHDCVVKLQSNGGFDVDAIEAAIDPLVKSVMRNKTAMAALTRMRKVDDYLYSHAISCSVWGAVLARELGLPPEGVNEVAFVCSVMDMGKTVLPRELLTSPDKPTDVEWEELKSHVERGVEILEDNGLTSRRVISAILSHHERHDGTGYPRGLEANKIPAYGRIAGIVDSYDAMITDRPYAKAKSSYAAIQELQTNADVLFQRELVEYFIKAIGVFPVGSIIELNTGEVGVVVAQTDSNRLKPKIMLILDEDKTRRDHLVVIDLSAQATDDNQPLQWWITKELPMNAYGIDPQDYFLG